MNKTYLVFVLGSSCIGFVSTTQGMGLRSFVALPVEKDGAVMRLAFEHTKDADTDSLTTSAAYGLSSKQTLLLGFPYRLSPAGNNRQGDISLLYRHSVIQDDSSSGTNRLGLLGGVVIPTDRDLAIQTGFVFTHFNNRHEIDIDALYQAGLDDRPDNGRYDLSWQYRLSPVEYPGWGIAQEWYSILELNGRWREGRAVTHQLTTGLQWVHQTWVLEGGVAKDLNNEKELRYLLNIRFHF